MRPVSLVILALAGSTCALLEGCATPRQVDGHPVLAPPDPHVEMAPPVPTTAASAPITTASATPSPPPTATGATPSTTVPTPTNEVDPRATADGQRATDAVMALPGVQGLCAEAKARGASSCSAWPSDAPTERCTSTAVAYENEPCWWAVTLEEVMTSPDGSGHANRIATFFVEPGSFTVKAATDFACADMLFTLPAYRAMKVRAAASGAVDCNGAVPYPTAPP